MHLDFGMILFVIKNDRHVIDEQVYKLDLQINYLIDGQISYFFSPFLINPSSLFFFFFFFFL